MSSRQLERVKELLIFLQPSFADSVQRSVSYSNMAALLADVSLQAGLNYDNVVKPRVTAIIKRYPNCRMTEDVLKIRCRVSTGKILQWRGLEKISRFDGLLDVISSSRVSTIEDLAEWSGERTAKSALLKINGIGEKTVDYLRLLCGRPCFPIDRHFIRFLKLADIDVKAYGYEAAQTLLMDSCAALGIEPRKAERSLWLLLRACV